MGLLQSRSLQTGGDNTQKIHAETALPPCSILPTRHMLPAPMWLVMLRKPREQLHQGLQGQLLRACKENHTKCKENCLYGLRCSYSNFPGQKAAPTSYLPVCLHNRSRKYACQLPAIHGKGIQQRNVIRLHFNSLGKNNQQFRIIHWGVTFSLTKKHNKKKNQQEKIHVWVLWEGECVFVLKRVILYVQLGKKENVQKYETQDLSIACTSQTVK